MAFRKLLWEIGQALASEDVKALCFLCTELLHQNLPPEEQATNLFNLLIKQGLLTEKCPHLLTELLLTIGRCPLVKEHGLPESKNQISAYRKLLFTLNQSITEQNLRDMKFLLREKLPEVKLENATTLLIFQELENAGYLSKSDFSTLESIFDSVYPVLNNTIAKYKETQGGSGDAEVVHEEREKPLPPPSQVLPCYTMKSAKRGTCVIINNENFKNLKQREGTVLDEVCASAVFDWLNFDVEVHRECDRKTILSVIRETAAKDHSQVDCLVCLIFSHGTEGVVVGVDGQSVMLRELTAPFTGSKCPSLTGKPKMFFIQACQGREKNDPVTIMSDSSVVSDAKQIHTIPSDADFLLGKSTVPTYSSYRDNKHGSWFIQSLCQHLLKLVPENVDLLSLMTEVSEDVSQKSDPSGVMKQMPNVDSSFRKRVVFPIPRAPIPQLPASTDDL